MSANANINIPHTIYERAVFVDTSALYALIDPKDNCHDQAVKCLNELEKQHLPLWITNWIVIESHDLILERLGKKMALSFINNIYHGSINVERASPQDESQAENCLRSYQDQEFSYTDALSFILMKRLGIGKSFSFDHHFNVAGFTIIPPLS